MKIKVEDKVVARSQMVDIMSRLMKSGHALSDVAGFASRFHKKIGESGLIEMHVFVSEDELSFENVSSPLLRGEVTHLKEGLKKQIAEDGFCIMSAFRPTPSRRAERLRELAVN